ncbi:MAG: hypothetical protein WD398_06015 [Cyclobacteriaceae bacterium]
MAQVEPLEVAAYTFSIHPKVGTPSGHSRTGNKIEEVHGDLKNTLLLIRQGDNKLCLFTSPLGVERGVLHDFCVNELSRKLDIPREAIVTNSSHNHTIPFLDVREVDMPEKGSSDYLSWELGREFIREFSRATDEISNRLTPVLVEWGVAEENRITYNRKGVRLDGSTYFMREEDRLNLKGEGYHGLIDPDAAIVVFKDEEAKPVAAISFFTGHPVAAYSPEKMISYGQFPQAASEILSKYLGGIPVAFVQGCGGNINAKHMLTGTIEQAKQLGENLGQSFIVAAKSLRQSKRVGLEWSREPVKIPLSELPDEESLKRDLKEMDDFIKRGNEGDENTLECIGMNFPKALTPPYRARLVEMVRPWYVWAIEQHETYNLVNIPSYLPIEIIVARFGDVGFVGLPYEAFVETGLKIKANSQLPFVLTCGYTDGSFGYIPDASGVDHREYMSGNYRYRGSFGSFIGWKDKKDLLPHNLYVAREYIPPYKAPAGDACADVAILKIAEFAR